MEMDMEWLEKAIETVRTGVAEKLTKGDVTVYICGSVIRIDIKVKVSE